MAHYCEYCGRESENIKIKEGHHICKGCDLFVGIFDRQRRKIKELARELERQSRKNRNLEWELRDLKKELEKKGAKNEKED